MVTFSYTKQRLIPVLSLVLAGGLVVGCSGVQKQLGLERSAPDEFNVVSRAPLSLPPDINLRPPQPGTTRPQEGTTADVAASALFDEQVETPRTGPLAGEAQFPPRDGGGVMTSQVGNTPPVQAVASTSRGEGSLLQKAGADNADPNIRQLVNAESTELASASASLTDKVLFWRKPVEPGTIVDADAERRRLQENEALGDSIMTGETPQIERKSRALLEGLFDF
ncbi:MAG: DUF3035 domain-containing protein [Pseudomonadota bacterium]